MDWVKIVSWHAVRMVSRGGMVQTYCGRWMPVGTPTVAELPGGKSCESCLRITARQDDADS